MFKKFNLSLFITLQALIITILCLSSRAFSSQEFYPFLAEVTADNVHIRSGQSENFESLLKVNKKDELVVRDKSYSWYKIELPPQSKSYISGEFVLIAKEGKGIIVANRLNIRSGPGDQYTVLGQLNEGEEVDIIDQKDEWIQIKPVKNTYGWINEKYISFKSKDVEDYQKKKDLADVKIVKASIPNSVSEKKEIKIIENKIKDEKNLEAKREQTVKESAQMVVHVNGGSDQKKEEPKEPKGLVLNKAEKAQDVQKDETIEVWDAFNKIKKVPKNAMEYVVVKGYLRPQKEIDSKEIKYKFLVGGKTVFYVQGFKHILEEFVNFQVELEGVVITEKQTKQTYPLVEVQRIQLVL